MIEPIAQMPWDEPLKALAKNALIFVIIAGFAGAAWYRWLEEDHTRSVLCLFVELFCGAMLFWAVVL